MKTILSSTRDQSLARLSILLITIALIAGMVGCVGVEYDLTITSTAGGSVTTPGEGTFTYDEGTVVNLVAEADEGYQFVNWTGNVSTIADVEDDTTTVTMDGDYSIAANFALEILEIWDWDDLDAVRDNLGSNYLLMNALDYTTANYTELASPTAHGGKGWEPLGTFTGSFDGQGYEIEDLFITRPNERYVGLFGYVDEGGVVKDIGVVNATVTGDKYVGGLVGDNGGTVSNSYSTGSVTGEWRVGGLVGDNEDTVSNSHFTGNVTSEGSYIGGLVGYNERGSVSNSYSTGSVTGSNKYVGGLVGCNYEESTVSDSYSTSNVTGDKYVGGLVGFSYKSIVRNSHYNYDEVLVLINGEGENIITIGALFGEDFDQWLANDKFLDVNERLSQEDGYYVVNNVTDFKELLAFGQNSSLKFRLTNDLDLGNEPDFYIPYFAGEFDGNGHKISNLSFNFDFAYNVGLFGCLAPGGRVSQVGVENVNITGASFVGGLVGANWEGTVSNSYSTGSMTGEWHVGGLVGCNYEESTVSDSYSTGNVTGDKYVGGLVGDNEDTVSNSYSTGSVTGDNGVGGLVGNNGGTVSNSYSSSSVTGDDGVGGLVGNNGGTVSNSYSTGSVSGDDDVGGLVGFNDGVTVKYSYSTGSVIGYDDVGGLVGYNEGSTVSNSYSTGSVIGYDDVGGLVGRNKEGTVNSSYSTGSVTGVTYVGGLVGENDGTVSRSFWDIETSGQSGSDGGTGKTTTEMKSITTFREWGITEVANPSTRNPSYIWNIVNEVTYPFLSWES